MFQIDEQIIKGNCHLSKTYERGVSYYQQRRIKSLSFDRRNMVVEGVARGTNLYNVYAAFGRGGELTKMECNCPAAYEYPGLCKHMVALLLTIMEQDEKGSFSSSYQKVRGSMEPSKVLFNSFDNAQRSTDRVYLNLRVAYEVNLYERHLDNIGGFLTLFIGEERLYVVRNFKRLMQAYYLGQSLEFSKNFTYRPEVHSFNRGDRKLMEFLCGIYEIQDSVESNSYYNNGGLYSGKRLMMPHSLARQFFEIMEIEDRSFSIILGDREIADVRVIEGNLPLSFDLNREGSDLLLEITHSESFTPLVGGGEYILVGDKVHKIPEERRVNYAALGEALKEIGGNRIRFTRDDRERLVSEVLPYMESLGPVTINSDVESIILKEDLHTEMYLRPQGEGIACDVRFIYGHRELNPFGGKDEVQGDDRQILIRKIKREQDIISALDEYGFSVQPGGVYLDHEERIFDFLYKGIPRLQEIAHIYYSEDFKGYMVSNRLSYTGGVRLNTTLDMLEFTFEVDDIDPSELGDIFKALREKKRYFRLKDGAFLNLENGELEEVAGLMDNLGLKVGEFSGDPIKIPKYRALYLDDRIKETGIKGIRRNKAFKELVSSIKEPGDLDLIPPKSLQGTLRGYQDFGFKWLKTLSGYGMGGILADDMGLGKTLQVITLLLSDKEEKGSEPSLVVVPTSLVYNWEDEVKKFAPNLKTLTLTGTKKERTEKFKDIEDADIVITSYPLIRRDGEDLKDYRFRYCILDEAQHIKNPDSQGAKMVKLIDAKARFALTGTPMENTLTELWSIFDFVMPGYLFSQGRFRREFETPIVKEGDEKASKQLSYHIKPFILRRVKKDVLKELPDKIEHKVMAELTVEQKKVYLAYMERIREDIEREIEDKGFEKSHIKILAGLTRLRQICCHPSTFLENYECGSGKMDLLGDIIDEALQGGHRILLFSQFTGMLSIIKDFLEDRRIDYLYLDGSTPMDERGQLVRAFNGGEGEIFLISLKAGGTGLNLTGADTVIHFDPWWNPAVEDQATDRAHRIGQEKVVHVMKLIARGTIEEKIFALQQKKKELIDRVIQPGHTLLSKMTEEEIRNLFAL